MAVVVYSESQGYGTSEVADVMGLSPQQVRSFVYAGLIEPVKGPRGDYRFSFQDLVLLRMGAQLQRSRVPLHAVRKALHGLREQLADDLPLSAIRVDALGETVIARDREGVWAPETGQRYFSFTLPEPDLPETATAVLEPADDRVADAWVEPRLQGSTATEWFDRAIDLEDVSTPEAKAAYRRALQLDPDFADAHANLGRLLHQEGRLDLAVDHYGRAAELDPRSATAAFNLGVALEDLGREAEAVRAYARALVADPERPEPHFNLARLYETMGRDADALHHLVEYRRLSRAR